MMPVTSQDISALNTEEKVKLAEALWQSIENDKINTLTPAQQELLNKRLVAHQQNPTEDKSWTEIKTKYL